MNGECHTFKGENPNSAKGRLGICILDVCLKYNTSERIFHRSKQEFGMMEISQAKRLQEL